jgi:hypothetical protein
MLSVPFARERATRAWLRALLTCLAAAGRAQQAPPEYRTQSISVFGAFLLDNIAYRPVAEPGFSAGLDLTHHFLRVPLAASLEARVSSASGSTAIERSYVFGPRVEYRLGRYRPYGDAEVGVGTIHFGPDLHSAAGYVGDKSTVIAGGVGVDIDLFRNLAAQVDFQAQHWDISPQYHQTFMPTLVTVGVYYTLPLRSFTRAGDPHYR